MADATKLTGFGGLASAAGNVLSAGISAIAQHYENKATRAHNLKLAQLQNQWNIEQWERNNDYNSPENQVARLKAAGLNPDLLYGGGIENTSTSSPQMTSGAPRTPTDWSSLANINPVGSYLDAQLKQAQIDNINAETKKTGAETSILTDEAAFTKALKEGELKLQDMEIKLGNKSLQLSDQQIKESQQRLMNMQGELQQINAQIQRWRDQTDNERKRIDIEKSVSKAQIKELASSANLKDEQAFSISQQLEPLIRQIEAQTNEADSRISVNDATTIRLGNEDVKMFFENNVLKMRYEVLTGNGEGIPLKSISDLCNFITRYIMLVIRN